MNQREAQAIVREAWQRIHGRAPTDLETTYTQAIAWLENQYGRARQFGELAADGKFNWGSLHARGTPPNCGPGSAPGVDLRPVCFQVFPTDVAAAAAFVRVLTKQHWPTVEAMTGSPEDVARAMRKAPAYYEGPPGTEDQKVTAYANAIRGGIRAIATQAPVPPIPTGKPSGGVPTWLLLAGLLGGAGYVYVQRYGSPLPELGRITGRLSRRLGRLSR